MKQRKRKNYLKRLTRRMTRRFTRLRDLGHARRYLIQIKDERENGPWEELFEKVQS